MFRARAQLNCRERAYCLIITPQRRSANPVDYLFDCARHQGMKIGISGGKAGLRFSGYIPDEKTHQHSYAIYVGQELRNFVPPGLCARKMLLAGFAAARDASAHCDVLSAVRLSLDGKPSGPVFEKPNGAIAVIGIAVVTAVGELRPDLPQVTC
jgi:hypothetical protein